MKARGRRRVPGEMNGTEAAYAEFLEAKRAEGWIWKWGFESLKLRLAKLCTYSPDFYVVDKDGNVELHEVKGFWRDDARVKIRVAAETFPEFRFVVVTKRPKKDGGGWNEEVVEP